MLGSVDVQAGIACGVTAAEPTCFRCYSVEREQMKDIIDSMIGTKELVVEAADMVLKAFRVFEASAKADFADCLIRRSAHDAECEYTVTFDVTASKAAGTTARATATPSGISKLRFWPT